MRGRSAGVRLLLAYQSDSQIRTAFKDKPTLLYDNCSTQIYLGAASSYETAERLSKCTRGLDAGASKATAKTSRTPWQQGGASQQAGRRAGAVHGVTR